MNINLLLVSYFAIIISVFLSCNTSVKPKSDVLLNHKWSYHEIRLNDRVTMAEEMGNPIITFRKDNTYMLEYGSMADSGTWEVKGDTTFITISKVSYNQSQDSKILMISNDTFRVQSVIDTNVLTLTLVPYYEKAN
jgi:hypothetical protein